MAIIVEVSSLISAKNAILDLKIQDVCRVAATDWRVLHSSPLVEFEQQLDPIVMLVIRHGWKCGRQMLEFGKKKKKVNIARADIWHLANSFDFSKGETKRKNNLPRKLSYVLWDGFFIINLSMETTKL